MKEFNREICNDFCEFRVLGKGEKSSEFLDLLLVAGKRFLV
jgi:hypothetical protein